MTNNKLYVSNLPLETTEHAVRMHFATCGGVADVELVQDRRTGLARGLACVTMTSPSFAAAALDRLNGAEFEGKVLRVSDSRQDPNKPPPRKVKVVQQFRERGNMAYELDCAGAPLTVRVFPADRDEWRLEATRVGGAEGADPVVVSSSAATRNQALTEIVRAWNEAASTTGEAPLDGDALELALREVRAV